MSNFRSIKPEQNGLSGPNRPNRPSGQGSQPPLGNRGERRSMGPAQGPSRSRSGKPVRRSSSRINSPGGARRSPSAGKRKGSGAGMTGRAFVYLIIFVLILLPTLISLIRTRSSLEKTKQEQASLQKEKEQLSASIEELNNQLQIVNTDEFIEKYAHEKLGMIRLNEILVQTQNGQYSVDQKKVKAITEGQQKAQSVEENASNSEDMPKEQASQEGQQ